MPGIERKSTGLALAPGLLLSAVLVSACHQESAPGLDSALCHSAVTPIQDIQGDGYDSPLLHTRQVVSGVVTRVLPDSGYFIEAPGDHPAETASRALFVEHAGGTGDVQAGQNVVVVGQVAELGTRRDTLTALTGIERSAVCESALPLPLTEATLPLDSRQREALEGMRLIFNQDLAVTDVYSRHRGEMTLAAGAPLRIPTEDAPPGDPARQAARANREASIDALLADPGTRPGPAGSRYRAVSGVLGHDGRDKVLLLETADGETAEPPTLPQRPAAGTLRIVNANLLNFFNGDGRGGGFPTERGAESLDEFERQQNRIQSAMAQLAPDLLAVQELENDGFGPNSAARALEALLEKGGNGEYATIEPPAGRVGSDVISVGLFYRPEVLTPVGPAHSLDAEPFQRLSRQPLAQLFRDASSGETLLVAVNHLKSKGSCPDGGPDANQDDGQGCWNPSRVAAVRALLPWLRERAAAAGTDRILVLGDMNAYRMEDPIRAFRDAGYDELVETQSGLPQYSYRHYGQAGTLDYAFASPALAPSVRQAFIWHINSDWPRNMALAQPWLRMSDHDPVVVDLQLGGQP